MSFSERVDHTRCSQSLDLLRGAISGELESFFRLKAFEWQVVEECVSRSGVRLTLSTEAVESVVKRLAAGDSRPYSVQQWASFVRWGFIPDESSVPISVLDIDFEPENQELIGEVIARLDEIGDVVDGVVSANEIESLLESLRSARRDRHQ